MQWIIGVIIAAVLFLIVMGIYNRLVMLRNRLRNAFAQIDVQLKRRHDLIPNLVETAKGYLKHERETLEAVVKARNIAVNAEKAAAVSPDNAQTMKSLMGAESALQGALSRLMVVVERYPDLKADKSMNRLMEELTSTENKVAFARQAFNDAVMAFNTARERFPAVLLSGAFGFQPATMFEITDATEREAPTVSF